MAETTITYLATDLDLDLTVDVVEYFPALLARRDESGLVGPAQPRLAGTYQRGLSAFALETRVLARCEHPSLAHAVRLLQARGTAYRVLPHREGQRLFALRAEMNGPPDEAALQTLLDGLLGALDTLHRAGHVHGQVHPGNIMLLADDRPLLLGPDWAARELAPELAEESAGLAAPAPPATWPGFAPLDGAPQVPSAPAFDLYALAEVVRFCISGELPPAHGAGPRESAAALAQRLQAGATPLRYRSALIRTLDAATSLRPQERPAHVAQFREWLANGPPAPERPPAAPEGDTFLTPEFLARLNNANAAAEAEATAPKPAGAPTSAPSSAPTSAPTSASTAAPPPVAAAHAPARQEPTLPPQAPATAPPPHPPNRIEPLVGASPAGRAEGDATLAPASAPVRRRHPAVLAAWGLAFVGLLAWGAWHWWTTPTDELALNSPTLQAERDNAMRAEADRVRRERTQAELDRAAQVLAAAVPGRAASQASAEPPSRASPPAQTAPVANDTEAALPSEPTAAGPAPAPHASTAAATTATAPTPQARNPAAAPASRQAADASPRSACGERTPFALYRCMKTQCEQRRWQGHAQCERLRVTDRVE